MCSYDNTKVTSPWQHYNKFCESFYLYKPWCTYVRMCEHTLAHTWIWILIFKGLIFKFYSYYQIKFCLLPHSHAVSHCCMPVFCSLLLHWLSIIHWLFWHTHCILLAKGLFKCQLLWQLLTLLRWCNHTVCIKCNYYDNCSQLSRDTMECIVTSVPTYSHV